MGLANPGLHIRGGGRHSPAPGVPAGRGFHRPNQYRSSSTRSWYLLGGPTPSGRVLHCHSAAEGRARGLGPFLTHAKRPDPASLSWVLHQDFQACVRTRAPSLAAACTSARASSLSSSQSAKERAPAKASALASPAGVARRSLAIALSTSASADPRACNCKQMLDSRRKVACAAREAATCASSVPLATGSGTSQLTRPGRLSWGAPARRL